MGHFSIAGTPHKPIWMTSAAQSKPVVLNGVGHVGFGLGPLRPAPPTGYTATSSTPSSSGSAVSYDEQLGETFTQNWTSMAWNVTAVAQNTSMGIGPAYLLNGLSNTGYWYQVGLCYDWPSGLQGYIPGFRAIFEVWNPSGQSIYPVGGGSLVVSLNGPVHEGDTVLLRLYFSGGQVVMSVLDEHTGASAEENYSAEGATLFVGNQAYPYLNVNSNGYFTGLMTEEYHPSPYYGGEKYVAYTNMEGVRMPSAVLWMDEYGVAANGQMTNLLFVYANTVFFSNPYDPQSLSEEGAAEYANAYGFFTGKYNLTIMPKGPTSLQTDVGVGVTAQYTLTIGGGIPPYTVYAVLANTTLEEHVSGTPTATLNITLGGLGVGRYQAYFAVVDSTRFSNTSGLIGVQVNPDPTAQITPATNPTDVGLRNNVTANVSGGTPPYTYTWYVDGVVAHSSGTPSFTFNPTHTGKYKVTLVVVDAVGYTTNTTVTIGVNPDPAITIHLEGAADLNQRVEVNYSVVGGTPPYNITFYLDGEPVGSTGAVTLTQLGQNTVWAVLRDGVGYTATSNTQTVTVNPDPTANISAEKAVLDVGQSDSLNATVSGGTPPYTYTWYVDGRLVQSSTTPTYVFEAPASGPYTVVLSVHDSAGLTVNATLTLKVNPDPTITISAPGVADLNQTILVSPNITGGTPPYHVAFYLDGQPAPSNVVLMVHVGVNWVYAVLTDAAGYTVSSQNLTVQVNPDPAFTAYIFTPKSTGFFVSGNVVVATVNVDGGTPPYTYHWYLNGVMVAKTTTPTYTYNLSKMGVYQLQVAVEDSVGYTANGLPVRVNYTYNYTDISAASLLAVVVIAAALTLTLRRKH